MTRDERAADHIATLKRKQAALTKELARLEAQQQAVARKTRDRRRYILGQLVEEAGLNAWSDADLMAVFQALAPLKEMPHLAAVLTRFLHGIRGNDAEETRQEEDRAHDSRVSLRETPGLEQNCTDTTEDP